MKNKNLIKLIGIIGMFMSIFLLNSFAFTSGSGTEADPYVIDTCNHLQDMQNNPNGGYKLGSNIDCSGVSYSPFNFGGSFDGNGYTISGLNEPLFAYILDNSIVYNLTLSNGNLNYLGRSNIGALTEKHRGIIDGVGVENYVINSDNSNIGGLVGEGDRRGSIIRNSYVINTQINGNDGSSDNVGGLIGHLQYTDVIETSYTNLNYEITGRNDVGGFVGENIGMIYDSYSLSNARGINNVGGFVGRNNGVSGEGEIFNSYSTSQGIASGSNGHSFVGVESSSNSNRGRSYNSFNDLETSGDNSNFGRGVESITTSEMKDVTTFSGYTGWNFENTWLIDENINNGYPQLRTFEPSYDNSNLYQTVGGDGSVNNPHLISSCEVFTKIGNSFLEYADYYELVNDIDCSNSPMKTIPQISSTGNFNGNGYTINGSYVPLFHNIKGKVYDIKLTNIDIKQDDGSNLGGLSNYITDNGIVEYIYIDGNIISKNDKIGGIIGRNDNILRYSESRVTIQGSTTNSDIIGGLVGLNNYGGIIRQSKVSNSNISGRNDVGGFVGRNDGTIYDSYSRSNAQGENNIGGFVGRNDRTEGTARIYNSFSTSQGIASGSNGHSFVGYNREYGSSGRIYNSFNDLTTSGDNSNYGRVTSLTTNELQDIKTYSGYVDWDFRNIWVRNNNFNDGYPELRVMKPNFDDSNLYTRLGGDGTVGNPYLIGNCEVLMNIDNDDIVNASKMYSDRNFELVNDIDCSNSPMKTVSGDFNGYFNGNDYTITGSYVPLFYEINGEIENLNFEDAEFYQDMGDYIGILSHRIGNNGLVKDVFTNGIIVTTRDGIGGIVGLNNGKLLYSKSYATIIGHQSYSNRIGGLVGYNNDDGIIRESYSFNNLITGQNEIGGFTGRNDGTIYDSYSKSPDIRGKDMVGGFTGRNDRIEGVARIYNSYSTGDVYGINRVNSFIGYSRINGNSGRAYDSYYDKTSNSQNQVGEVTGLTTNQFNDIRYFSGILASWDFDSVWYMDSQSNKPALQKVNGVSNPIPTMNGDGSVSNPYQITSCRQLYNIPDSSTNSYILINDIDCSESEMKTIDNFNGIFDGNNNAIEYPYESLFNSINGDVKNLKIVNFGNVLETTYDKFGVLARETNSNSRIENIYATGTIRTKSNYNGGIIGQARGGQIDELTSYVNVLGSVVSSDNIGGVFGYTDGAVMNKLSSYGDVTGRNRIGGIVGYKKSGIMTDVFSLSSLEGNSEIGGIIGRHYGHSSNNGRIYNSYWSGDSMIGNSKLGGIVGSVATSYAYTFDSFWNSDINGITTNSGGGTEISTSQLQTQSTFPSSWNFSSIWYFDSSLNGFPNLNLQTQPQINPFNVYINYPENNDLINLNSSLDDITLQYLHDSNSTDVSCKFYIDGALYYTTYNTGNSIQSFTLSRWKDKQYTSTLVCSDGVYETSVTHNFEVNVENDLLTSNPIGGLGGETLNSTSNEDEISLAQILNAINNLDITVDNNITINGTTSNTPNQDSTILQAVNDLNTRIDGLENQIDNIEVSGGGGSGGDTTIYRNYYTGERYSTNEFEEEINKTRAIKDPRTNESINTTNKTVIDVTPFVKTVMFENGTLLSNVKPQNFYDNVLTEPYITSEKAEVENGLGSWILDNILMGWVVLGTVFGITIYSLRGFRLGKTKWQRFYRKTLVVGLVGGSVLLVISLLPTIL